MGSPALSGSPQVSPLFAQAVLNARFPQLGGMAGMLPMSGYPSAPFPGQGVGTLMPDPNSALMQFLRRPYSLTPPPPPPAALLPPVIAPKPDNNITQPLFDPNPPGAVSA